MSTRRAEARGKDECRTLIKSYRDFQARSDARVAGEIRGGNAQAKRRLGVTDFDVTDPTGNFHIAAGIGRAQADAAVAVGWSKVGGKTTKRSLVAKRHGEREV